MPARAWRVLTFGVALATIQLLYPPSSAQAQEVAPDTVGACWSYRTPDASFRAEVVAHGLQVPVSLAFLPDGRALVAERPVGRLSYVDLHTGALTPIDSVPPVVSQVDGGLLDVILHPDFTHNHRIFYTYAEHTDSGNATVVERATLDGHVLRERTRLLSVHPYIDNVNQFGARLLLTGGYLYVAIGEREIPAMAQDLSTDAGKIVRIREDGTVPPDNPFVGRIGVRPEIWSWGHRNPQGLAIRPGTIELWEHEHGPRGGDEINVIHRGRNYGWPIVTYGIEYTGEPVGEGVTHRAGLEQPVYVYVPSIAPSGMAFYTGSGFPRWRNDLFLGALSYRHLNRVVLEGRRVVREERLLRDRHWRIREVRMGSDGLLYVGVESGLLVRLRPEPRNVASPCAEGIGTDNRWHDAQVEGRGPNRGSTAMAYDADRHVVVRAGGDSLWEWNGKAWNSDTAIPPSHAGHAMATNPDGGVMLVGGRDANGAPLEGTWQFDGKSWKRLDAPGPAGRVDASLAYDFDHHRVLLFGGTPCVDRATWSWEKSAWHQLTTDGPSPRGEAAMGYDPTTRTTLLVGGRDCRGRLVRDVWRLDGDRWSKLAAPAPTTTPGAFLVYSVTRNHMLLFAGAKAFLLQGNRWQPVAERPPRLADASFANDVGSDRVVLVGRRPDGRMATFLLVR